MSYFSRVQMARGLIVFDLDETLIHSREFDGGGDHSFKIEGGQFSVAIRPGVEALFRSLRPSFDIAVFTAATRSYAQQVIKLLQRHCDIGELKFLFTRENCVAQPGGHRKPLSLFAGYQIENVLLVDNNPESFQEENRQNAVPIQDFCGRPDQELIKLEAYLSLFDPLKPLATQNVISKDEFLNLKKTAVNVSRQN